MRCAQILMRYHCEVLGAGGQATVHKTVFPLAVKGVSSPIPATGTTTRGRRMLPIPCARCALARLRCVEPRRSLDHTALLLKPSMPCRVGLQQAQDLDAVMLVIVMHPNLKTIRSCGLDLLWM